MLLAKISKSFNLKLLIIYTLSLFVLWRNPAGDDINLARQTFLSSNKTDYLGATGTVFYGLIPNGPLMWWHLLLIIQLTFAGVGLFLISLTLSLKSRGSNYFFTIFSYLTLVFAGASSRDGMILSLLIFVIGIFLQCKYLSNLLLLKITEFLAYVLLVSLFSFRPWLSIVALPIHFWNKSIRYNKKVFSFFNLIIAVFLLIAPFLVDQANKKIFDLNSHFPQQMVMLHDLSTTYCWGSDSKATSYSEKALSLLATNKESLQNICQFYRPNTWQAIVFPNTEFLSVKNLKVPIELIGTDDFVKYDKFRNYWIFTILSDPFTYIQNHLIFAVQVVISGDTRELRLIKLIKNINSDFNYHFIFGLFYGLFLLPIDLITTFHLLSPLIILLLDTFILAFCSFCFSFILSLGLFLIFCSS